MADRIRVLNILSDTNIGGAGRYLINFLKYYDREKFDISVVLPRGSLMIPEVEAQNTRVIQVDGMGDKSLDFQVIRYRKLVLLG